MGNGELQSYGGERSNRCVDSKVDRVLHRGSVPTSTPQPETPVCSPARAGGGLGVKARASEVRPQGKDWGWLCEDSLRGLVRHS